MAKGIYAITGGNPLFVTEVLAAPTDIVPATVRDAVLARALKLSPAARDIAELVCVVPGKAEAWLLDQTVPADAENRRPSRVGDSLEARRAIARGGNRTRATYRGRWNLRGGWGTEWVAPVGCGTQTAPHPIRDQPKIPRRYMRGPRH